MKKATSMGILSSFFFAFTFLLNRSMNLGGGYWLWSATLRYLFTLPIIAIPLLKRKELRPVFDMIRETPGKWFLWSIVGFGLFYISLSAAAIFAESWFTAAIWQISIVTGVLLTPFFGKKIPVKSFLAGCVILLGITIMQAAHFGDAGGNTRIYALLLTLIAAFSYPLGNRKMMEHTDSRLTSTQRVFGMTLCSWPVWILCAVIAGAQTGAPSGSQLLQSLCVALFSGVIATSIFFHATDMVKDNPKQLAVVEATQSGEVIFALIFGILFLKDAAPGPAVWVGILLIIIGMIASSLAAQKK